MNHLYDNYGVQEGAIACLQDLTVNEFVLKEIHPSLFAKVTEAMLNAMERFDNYRTLQEVILSMFYYNYGLLVCILFLFVFSFIYIFLLYLFILYLHLTLSTTWSWSL